MRVIAFTINGNQEYEDGNPIPYFRTTQGSQFTEGAIRYREWKKYVQKTYKNAVGEAEVEEKKTRMTVGEYHEFIKKDKKSDKPIDLKGSKAYMTLQITFSDKTHGDCDNVFKGIADALFQNDKTLASRGFDYQYGKSGRVDVLIEILTNEKA